MLKCVPFVFYSRAKNRPSGDFGEQCKRVLLLGAGYVSAPVVEYLTRSNDAVIYVGMNSTSLMPFSNGYCHMTSQIGLRSLWDLSRHLALEN